MVECGGLENRCTARYRGFESLLLCKELPSAWHWVFLFSERMKLVSIVTENKKMPSRIREGDCLYQILKMGSPQGNPSSSADKTHSKYCGFFDSPDLKRRSGGFETKDRIGWLVSIIDRMGH